MHITDTFTCDYQIVSVQFIIYCPWNHQYLVVATRCIRSVQGTLLALQLSVSVLHGVSTSSLNRTGRILLKSNNFKGDRKLSSTRSLWSFSVPLGSTCFSLSAPQRSPKKPLQVEVVTSESEKFRVVPRRENLCTGSSRLIIRRMSFFPYSKPLPLTSSCSQNQTPF